VKYHNKKTTVNGFTFDSKGEANRYLELGLLKRAGEISDLILQPKYILQESFKKNGKTHRAITYIADFEYYDRLTKKWVVEDFKGFETEAFKIKLKLFEKRYPDKELKLVRGR
jgi:hypothetical protein